MPALAIAEEPLTPNVSVTSGLTAKATLTTPCVINENSVAHAGCPTAAFTQANSADAAQNFATCDGWGRIFEPEGTSKPFNRSTTESIPVNSTDTPPLPAAIPAPSASQSGAPMQGTLGATDGEGDAVTRAAQAVGYYPAYDLQQIYHFIGIGYASAGGVTAYVSRSTDLGGAGDYYPLKSNGSVYSYDGSGFYAHTFANGSPSATLDPGVCNTPTLLAPAAVVTVRALSRQRAPTVTTASAHTEPRDRRSPRRRVPFARRRGTTAC